MIPTNLGVDDVIKRTRWGDPIILSPDGTEEKPHVRISKLPSFLDDPFPITQWKNQKVMLATATTPDIAQSAAAVIDPDSATGKKVLNGLISQALEVARAGSKANEGTAIHGCVEGVITGRITLDQVPQWARGDVAACLKTLQDNGLEPVKTETFVVADDIGAAGTFDLLVKARNRYYIADIKTGSIKYADKHATQLGGYANGREVNPATGQRIPLPEPLDRERGIIIHLPAGEATCTLYWIDIAAGWEAAKLAVQVREWRKRKGLLTEWTPPTPTAGIDWQAVDEADAIRDAIYTASTVDEVRSLWTRYVEAGWDQGMVTDMCQQRVATLTKAA